MQEHEPTIGARVVTNEGYWGTIESVASEADAYQCAWYNVRYDADADHNRAGMTVMQDAQRMTRRPFNRQSEPDPHPNQ